MRSVWPTARITSILMALALETSSSSLAFQTQDSLVEVEQGVSSDGDLLASRLHGSSRSGRGSGLVSRGAGFLRQEVFVALAASGILGGSSRGPVAGTPAEAETGLGNDVALVDDVDALLSDGGETDTGQQGQHQGLLGDILDHCFPSLKKNIRKIRKPVYPPQYLL